MIVGGVPETGIIMIADDLSGAVADAPEYGMALRCHMMGDT
tara:strand:+ start:3054 stop:3176 length:123 start_codon:yes stop_codon:yes gene_type:complete